MPVELYQFDPSPPCRMVRLLADYLQVELELKEVNVMKGDQFEDDYLQLNPQHTIPTMVDDGLVLTESRAMLMYLANKYGGNEESLYPTDPEKRAVVDMRICFELTTLNSRFNETYMPVMWRKLPLDPAKVDKLDEALGYVDTFLKDGFIAGSELTIADFAVAVTLSTISVCGHDLSSFSEIPAYLEKCADLMKAWEEVNMAGANILGQCYAAALAEVEANN